MNAKQVKALPKSLARRVFAYEILWAIEKKRLQEIGSYCSRDGKTCYSCAIGAAVVFEKNFRGDLDGFNDRPYNEVHADCVKAMQRFGFSAEEANLIEWLFETDDAALYTSGIDTLKPVYQSLKNQLHEKYEDRQERMVQIYTRIYKSKSGRIKPLKEKQDEVV